ncbi:MAG: DHA2 family efflux MFS transporter permease subunit [Thiohalocapsa sp.]
MSTGGRRLAAAALMIATALQAADTLIVNVALPQLERDLGGGIELGTWVVVSYLCATAVTAPLAGWLRRRYGAGRLFPLALTALIATSLLCAAAPSATAMIAARVLQGAAGGVILPLAQAMLLDITPQERHGRVLGMLGAVLMLGPILAPPLGGLITDLSSWRAVFLVNLPLGLFSIAGVRRLRYPEDALPPQVVDAVGIVLLTVAVAALQLCLEGGVGGSSLHPSKVAAEAAIAAAAIAAIALRARRSRFTVFRPEIFKDLNFAVAAFYNFVTCAVVFVTLVLLPVLAQEVFDFSATVAGLTMVPRALVMMLVMLAVGGLMGRIDCRILLCLGWLTMFAGLAILARVEPEHAFFWLVAGSCVQAVGAGMLFTPHSTLAYSTLPQPLRTDASGLYSLLRQLGFASGVAVMATLLQLRIELRHDELKAVVPTALLDRLAAFLAYRDCFAMMAVAALACIPGVFLFRAAGAAALRAGRAPVR